jgi:hypothetical protein
MGVRKYDRIEICNWKGKLAILVSRFLPFALKHPTIEGDRMSIYMQEMTRAGDFPSCTDEGYLQGLPFSYGVALK